MIFSLVLVSVVALAAAAPQGADKDRNAQIISQTNDLNPDGSYTWSFQTDNGIQADATGSIRPAQDPKDGNIVVSQGSFSYTAPDGSPIQVTYVADDLGGFQPQGAHLPTPPPIPPAIQRALDYIASLPPQQQQGQQGQQQRQG